MGKPTAGKSLNREHNPQWDTWSYRIGCPVWACKHWGNQVYPNSASSQLYLDWYSHCFPTVEGNSTFYAVPGDEVFRRWNQSVAKDFSFSFKFPREISHYRKLKGCDDLLAQWLARLSILQDDGKLGPTFLQLDPSFSPSYLPQLTSFLMALPRDWQWAVEVRHVDWFDQGPNEERLNELLCSLNIDRVLFDSRPLNSREASDQFEEKSQSRKPKSPFRRTVTGKRPMVRLIGRNNLEEVASYWEDWAIAVAQWIREGLQPYIFTHAPDDAYAPLLARHLHDLIRLEIPSLPPLPSWQDCLLEDSKKHNDGDDGLKQMSLF